MITRFLVIHIASGQSFFTGSVCLVIAAGISRFATQPLRRIVRNLFAAVGGILVFASATPLPPWAYLILATATVIWLSTETRVAKLSVRRTAALRGAVISLWLAAMIWEVPYHLTPRLAPLGESAVGIIGDSLTAGIGEPKDPTWPGILVSEHALNIHNHAQAGATVAAAQRQVDAVAPSERLIVLEIGGNDILGGTSPSQFGAGLTRLLRTLRQQPGRAIVMLELPLPPTYNAYGRIQRRLAREFKVSLVPKRVLLGILQDQSTTLDSIHLSPEGHHKMAEAVWRIIGPAFQGERRDRSSRQR